MTRRALLAAALCAVAAVLPASARGAVRDGFYGVNAQYVFSTAPSSWPRQFSAMQAGGIQVVRTDARWSAAEPGVPSANGRHSYDWSFFDSVVGTLAQHGIRWMPTLDYPPPWAQENPANSGSEMQLTHVDDFLAYAAAMAGRYGIGGTFWRDHPSLPALPVREWEVWNEPNVTYYWNPQDNAPERYADLYLATRQAIKSVNFKATVLAGGLALVNPPVASSEILFIRRMFKHRPDLTGAVDVWGLHPYQETIYYTFRRFARWRQELDKRAGSRQPIAITELGYTTTKVTDAERGQELSELAQELPRSGCDVYDFIPYSWLSPEQDSTDPEQWFGIWNLDGAPKPSGQQYVNSVLQMRGLSSTAAPAADLNLCDPQYPVPADPARPAPGPLPQPSPLGPAPPAKPRAIAPPKRHGPGLELSIRRDSARKLLKITADCRSACRLQAYLMTRRPGSKRFKVRQRQRTRRFSSRAQHVRFRIRPSLTRLAGRAEIVVVALDRSGASSRVSRRVRLG